MKYYKISEDDLLDLLTRTEILNCLECNGVDNWFGYMDNRTEYVADVLGTTEDNVHEDDLGFRDIANKMIKDYELLKEEKPICAICGKECENEFGNSPWPLLADKEARCCNKCNDDYVVMFRMWLTFSIPSDISWSSGNDSKELEEKRKRFMKIIKS